MLGPSRVAARLSDLAAADSAAVVHGLRTAAEEFSGGTLADDLCVVALRMRALPVLRPE